MNARLVRSRSDVMLGGVCAGLGRYLNIDPTIVRLFFVLLALAGGGGVLIYIILWIVIPAEDNPLGNTPLTGDEFGNRARMMGEEMRQVATQPDKRVGLFIGGGLVLIGLYLLVKAMHIPWLSWLDADLIWPALLVLGGVALLIRAYKGDR